MTGQIIHLIYPDAVLIAWDSCHSIEQTAEALDLPLEAAWLMVRRALAEAGRDF